MKTNEEINMEVLFGNFAQWQVGDSIEAIFASHRQPRRIIYARADFSLGSVEFLFDNEIFITDELLYDLHRKYPKKITGYRSGAIWIRFHREEAPDEILQP